MRFVVPEDGRGEAGVGEHGEGFGHVPAFRAGAAAHDEDGLVGVVLVLRRVVVGGEEVAVGKLLDGGVVVVDADARRDAELPADAGHAVVAEIGEEFVGVVPGLGGVGAGVRALGAMGCCLTAVSKKKCCGGRGLGVGMGRLHDAEADVAFLRGVGGSHAGAVGCAGEVGRGGGDVEVGELRCRPFVSRRCAGSRGRRRERTLV